MTENTLDLPFIAVIPYNVQIDDSISDACKLYFGQIVGLAKLSGYMWATDEQLAEMKGVSKRTIERWNTELELAGHIRRETSNVPVKAKDGEFGWTKKRKIYFNDGFQRKENPQPKKPKEKPEESKSPDEIFDEVAMQMELESRLKQEVNDQFDPAKNGGSYGTDNFGGSYDPAKNGGIIRKPLEESLKEQCDPSGSVVVQSLQRLEIQETLRVKICREYSEVEIDKAVERCLNWKTRPSDEVGIMTTLARADSWHDNATPEQMAEKNMKYLKTLSHLDGTNIGRSNITIGNKYVEFVSGMKVTVFNCEDKEFKKGVVDYIDYLKRLRDSRG